MVEMHNGCICCTLRGDLLKTVKTLSEEGKFDYLVIESTGIGEPLPVAQTFVMDVDSMEESTPVDSAMTMNSKKQLTVATDEKKSLFHYAKLDTLVTVVDALNIYDVLTSIETLADKDNVSGMIGNTGVDTGDVTDKYPGGKAKMEEQRKKVVESAMLMPIKELQKLLSERGLNPKGGKEELVMRLVEAFEAQLLEALKEQTDNRSIARLWLDQIEFANVIVVSKASRLLERNGGDTKKLKEIENMMKKLNPNAHIIIPSVDMYGDLDVSKTLINTGLFDMEEASRSSSWVHELEAEEHNPETLEYGISSTTFIATDMPFHPERLHTALGGFGSWFMALQSGDGVGPGNDKPAAFKGVVRTKGQMWIANSHAFPVNFQTAGQAIELHPSEHPFIVEKKGNFSKEDQEAYEWMQENGWWTDEWGDHRSQLVFIGVDLDKEEIHSALNKALLTKEESDALGGQEGWVNLKDPFYNGKLAQKNASFYEYMAKQSPLENQITK